MYTKFYTIQYITTQYNIPDWWYNQRQGFPATLDLHANEAHRQSKEHPFSPTTLNLFWAYHLLDYRDLLAVESHSRQCYTTSNYKCIQTHEKVNGVIIIQIWATALESFEQYKHVMIEWYRSLSTRLVESRSETAESLWISRRWIEEIFLSGKSPLRKVTNGHRNVRKLPCLRNAADRYTLVLNIAWCIVSSAHCLVHYTSILLMQSCKENVLTK